MPICKSTVTHMIAHLTGSLGGRVNPTQAKALNNIVRGFRRACYEELTEEAEPSSIQLATEGRALFAGAYLRIQLYS